MPLPLSLLRTKALGCPWLSFFHIPCLIHQPCLLSRSRTHYLLLPLLLLCFAPSPYSLNSKARVNLWNPKSDHATLPLSPPLSLPPRTKVKVLPEAQKPRWLDPHWPFRLPPSLLSPHLVHPSPLVFPQTCHAHSHLRTSALKCVPAHLASCLSSLGAWLRPHFFNKVCPGPPTLIPAPWAHPAYLHYTFLCCVFCSMCPLLT